MISLMLWWTISPKRFTYYFSDDLIILANFSAAISTDNQNTGHSSVDVNEAPMCLRFTITHDYNTKG